MTPREELERANQAERLLNDELYIETFAEVHRHLMKKWGATAPEDVTTREECFRELRVLDKLRGVLEYYARNKNLHIMKINTEKKRAKQH